MALNKTFNSSSYVGKDGRNLSLTVTESSVNHVDNSSTITWTLTTSGGDVTYYDTYCNVTINGRNVYYSKGASTCAGYYGWITNPNPNGIWIDRDGNENTCAKWGFSTSGTLTVYHNNDGNKSINISFLVGCFYYVVKECGGSFSLSKTDRTEPKITQNEPTNITYNSCSISASSNVNCSKWWYRKRVYTSPSWENWIEINSSGTSKSTNITELLPNTEYEFQWCGRKASNSVDGYSSTKVIKTLGASKLNKINNIYLDVESPKLELDVTCYATKFYHRLVLSKANKTMTFDLGWYQVGDNFHSIQLNQSRINTLIDWIGITSFTCTNITATLTTYEDNTYTTQIGDSSILTNALSLLIRKENAIPTFTVGGYEDTNSSTIANTGNNQYIVPNNSLVRINNIVGETKLGARIVSIVGVLSGNVTRTIFQNPNAAILKVTSYKSNYDWGSIANEHASFIELTLTDSRGLKVKQSILLSIYRQGYLVKASDYNSWFNILASHFNAKDYSGKYFISKSFNSGFNLPGPKVNSNIILAKNINSEVNGMYKHFNSIPINNSSDYYYEVRDAIENLKVFTSSVKGHDIEDEEDINEEDILIEAKTQTDIDREIARFDNIVLFNLVKGGS